MSLTPPPAKENYFMDPNHLENMFNGWISVRIYQQQLETYVTI